MHLLFAAARWDGFNFSSLLIQEPITSHLLYKKLTKIRFYDSVVVYSARSLARSLPSQSSNKTIKLLKMKILRGMQIHFRIYSAEGDLFIGMEHKNRRFRVFPFPNSDKNIPENNKIHEIFLRRNSYHCSYS